MREFRHKQTSYQAQQLPNGDYDVTFGIIPRCFIEASNDWEEISIPNDYEILSFKVRTKWFFKLGIGDVVNCKIENNTYKWKLPNGNWDFYSYFSTSESLCVLLDKVFDIHSVKRLSDDVVFTIGDKVRDSLTDALTNNKVQTIDYFNPGGKIVCYFKSGTTAGLASITHAHKPLFTTEDGKEIFEGDDYWWITTSLKYISNWPRVESYVANGAIANKHSIKNDKERCFLNFSTKEAAEEYILMNKPSLSVNDVIRDAGYYSSAVERLKQLVKSKL